MESICGEEETTQTSRCSGDVAANETTVQIEELWFKHIIAVIPSKTSENKGPAGYIFEGKSYCHHLSAGCEQHVCGATLLASILHPDGLSVWTALPPLWNEDTLAKETDETSETTWNVKKQCVTKWSSSPSTSSSGYVVCSKGQILGLLQDGTWYVVEIILEMNEIYWRGGTQVVVT